MCVITPGSMSNDAASHEKDYAQAAAGEKAALLPENSQITIWRPITIDIETEAKITMIMDQVLYLAIGGA